MLAFDPNFFFRGMQHIDSPDNNPGIPWEFSDANKEKASDIHYL